ncbi:MAG: ribosome maturation factor RimM [Halothiobacillaceae bacterium]|nr:MAG: ribosome maturation factor RimM [Halothiobacillaceae bacterium]
MTQAAERVSLGKVLAAFGIQGWLKIHSESRPMMDIGRYKTWQLKLKDGWTDFRVKSVKVQGKGLIAKLDGVSDRNQAEALAGADIAIAPELLPRLPKGEFYWRDLIGMQVVTREGIELGEVEQMLETGANDVMVLKGERERLVPYIFEQVVLEVDPEARRITVDWDPEF